MPDTNRDITFNRALIAGRELEHMKAAVAAMHLSCGGGFTQRCSALLERELSVKGAVLTTSCTAALEMTALFLDAQPGDEVIVPSYSFVSSVNAYTLHGMTPVFADVREDTLNMDEREIERLLSDRTRAIVVVHYAGVACAMEPILAAAASRGVDVIEDNAHGLFASYHGQPLGSFGRFATLSFHETKNLTCGEGGALLLNRESDVARAEILRDKGTNRQQLFRGEVDKYTWVDKGSSFGLSDLLAAYLYGQIEARDSIARARKAIWQRYDVAFRGVVERHGVQLPHLPEGCIQSHHMYWMLLPDLATRSRFLDSMRAGGICCVSHYQPLHASAMGRKLAPSGQDCPVTNRVADRLVRLPFYNDLSVADQDRVIEETLRLLA